MKKSKGVIALDIDGTITSAEHKHLVPLKVVDYFAQRINEGWNFFFISGRSYTFSHEAVKDFTFPFYLGVQNGALILEMPANRVVRKVYMERNLLAKVDDIFRGAPVQLYVFGDPGKKEGGYFVPRSLPKELEESLANRWKRAPEPCTEVSSFDQLEELEFPIIKCFGEPTALFKLSERVRSELGLSVSVIKDPLHVHYHVALVTHPQATKGMALRDCVKNLGDNLPVIAAGDDLNDESMLDVADVKIAMKPAPQRLLDKADIIGEPSAAYGIMAALDKAIALVETMRLTDARFDRN